MKLRTTLCSVCILLFTCLVTAQSWLDLRERGANFNEIQAAFNKQNKGKIKKFKRELLDEVRGKASKAANFERDMEGLLQYHRWAAFVEPRVLEANGDMSAMNEGMMRAIAKKNAELPTRSANWTLIGPKSITTDGGNGRINAVRAHPTDPNILFACSPAGGLWKSTNGGGSWVAISDAISALGCTDVAFDPNNPNTMYLVTGDGEAADAFTLGVYKSTDGGSSWAATGLVFNLANSKVLSKVLVNPENGNTILVGGSAGIYRTNDGGETWTQTSTNSVRDLEFKPDNPSVVYAGGYGAAAGFWRSNDGGTTWTKNTNNMTSGIQRVAIAVSSLDANYVYALTAKTNSFDFEGLYVSTDGGTNFTKKSSSPNILGWENGTASAGDATNGQGWYDLALTVSPTDLNTIFTGGINIWKSTNGGTSWTKNTAWDAETTANNYAHADIHDLYYVGNQLFAGTDGGISTSNNNGSSWSDISSNLAIAQIYGLGLSAKTESLIIQGQQDNGTNLTTNASSWTQVNGGDGMLCFVDYANDRNLFASIYNGNLYRSTNGGSSFSKIYTVTGGAWVTPWLQDPINASTLYAGGNNVVKSTNSGSNWSTISSFSSTVGTLIALAVAHTDAKTLVAVSKTKVMLTTNGGTSWTDITRGLPTTASIQTVHIDVNDATKIYVGIASYTGNSAFVSTNSGANWINISAGMPQIPVNCFVSQKNLGGAVYCGTDLGVYYTSNSGTNWENFTYGMPGVSVTDLEVFYPTGLLRASTYGRGVWESKLTDINQAPSVSISSPSNNGIFSTPTTIIITADASDSDGSISDVEFYNGTRLLGRSNRAPFSLTWENVPSGSYVLTVKAIDNAGASATSAPVNISVSAANDAGISAINQPNGAINSTNITPSLILKNFGNATLTSARILYKFDNQAENTFDWTGSLAPNGSQVVNLASITGYGEGNHSFSARSSNPNGATDENTGNDGLTANFSFSSCSNANEPADNSSSTATVLAVNTAINSQIGSATDVDYYKFTTTTANPKIKIGLTNLAGDFDISLYKASAAGNLSSLITTSQNSSNLAESILYNTPTAGATYYIKIYGYGGANSTTQCYNLSLNTSSTSFIKAIRESSLVSDVEKNMAVFPNPAKGMVNIRFTALEEGDFQMQLVDVAGKTLIQQNRHFNNGENSLELDINNIAGGLYFVKLTNEIQSAMSKLLIEK
jgi:Bacterial Ig domain/Secretion system C-terminal sorting domain/Bacterial pre-peptidase C-terminal domain